MIRQNLCVDQAVGIDHEFEERSEASLVLRDASSIQGSTRIRLCAIFCWLSPTTSLDWAKANRGAIAPLYSQLTNC